MRRKGTRISRLLWGTVRKGTEEPAFAQKLTNRELLQLLEKKKHAKGIS